MTVQLALAKRIIYSHNEALHSNNDVFRDFTKGSGRWDGIQVTVFHVMHYSILSEGIDMHVLKNEV